MCIAFGIESNKIRLFFNGFTSFDFVVPPIKSIGSVSANGFIKDISYSNLKYTANAILKSSANYNADNLFYEYIVGLQVNKWKNYFPCFVETYGLYKYKDDAQYEYMKTHKSISDVNILKNSLSIISTSNVNNPNYNYGDACTNSKYFAVLIQHIKKSQSYFNIHNSLDINETLAILAQVYFPLGRLTNEFVHYDLHGDNVQLYQPAADKFIHFYYHFEDGNVVQFKSYYIAKIIDYGRSYISSSMKIHKKLCNTTACNPDCGYDNGFAWMDGKTLLAENYYINSAIRNPSHDLRLFKMFFPGFKSLKYGVGINNSDNKEYGTKPNYTSGMPNAINNVADASKYFQLKLSDAIRQAYFNGPDFPENKKFADLHIYMNMTTPMKLIKV